MKTNGTIGRSGLAGFRQILGDKILLDRLGEILYNQHRVVTGLLIAASRGQLLGSTSQRHKSAHVVGSNGLSVEHKVQSKEENQMHIKSLTKKASALDGTLDEVRRFLTETTSVFGWRLKEDKVILQPGDDE